MDNTNLNPPRLRIWDRVVLRFGIAKIVGLSVGALLLAVSVGVAVIFPSLRGDLRQRASYGDSCGGANQGYCVNDGQPVCNGGYHVSGGDCVRDGATDRADENKQNAKIAEEQAKQNNPTPTERYGVTDNLCHLPGANCVTDEDWRKGNAAARGDKKATQELADTGHLKIDEGGNAVAVTQNLGPTSGNVAATDGSSNTNNSQVSDAAKNAMDGYLKNNVGGVVVNGCNVNLGLCPMVDPTSGALVGWVPSDKPVFGTFEQAGIARQNLSIGDLFVDDVKLSDGKEIDRVYNYNWQDKKPEELGALITDPGKIAEIKALAEKNKVQVDERGNVLTNQNGDLVLKDGGTLSKEKFDQAAKQFAIDQENKQKEIIASVQTKEGKYTDSAAKIITECANDPKCSKDELLNKFGGLDLLPKETRDTLMNSVADSYKKTVEEVEKVKKENQAAIKQNTEFYAGATRDQLANQCDKISNAQERLDCGRDPETYVLGLLGITSKEDVDAAVAKRKTEALKVERELRAISLNAEKFANAKSVEDLAAKLCEGVTGTFFGPCYQAEKKKLLEKGVENSSLIATITDPVVKKGLIDQYNSNVRSDLAAQAFQGVRPSDFSDLDMEVKDIISRSERSCYDNQGVRKFDCKVPSREQAIAEIVSEKQNEIYKQKCAELAGANAFYSCNTPDLAKAYLLSISNPKLSQEDAKKLAENLRPEQQTVLELATKDKMGREAFQTAVGTVVGNAATDIGVGLDQIGVAGQNVLVQYLRNSRNSSNPLNYVPGGTLGQTAYDYISGSGFAGIKSEAQGVALDKVDVEDIRSRTQQEVYNKLVSDNSGNFYNSEEAARLRMEPLLSNLGEKTLNDAYDRVKNGSSWADVERGYELATQYNPVIAWNNFTGGRFKRGNDTLLTAKDPAQYIRGAVAQGGDAAAVAVVLVAPIGALSAVAGVSAGLGTVVTTGVLGTAVSTQMYGMAADACELASQGKAPMSQCTSSTSLAVVSSLGTAMSVLKGAGTAGVLFEAETVGTSTLKALPSTVENMGLKALTAGSSTSLAVVSDSSAAVSATVIRSAGNFTKMAQAFNASPISSIAYGAGEHASNALGLYTFTTMTADGCKNKGDVHCLSTALMMASSIGKLSAGIGKTTDTIANGLHKASAGAFAVSACSGAIESLRAGSGQLDAVSMCGMALHGGIEALKSPHSAIARSNEEWKISKPDTGMALVPIESGKGGGGMRSDPIRTRVEAEIATKRAEGKTDNQILKEYNADLGSANMTTAEKTARSDAARAAIDILGRGNSSTTKTPPVVEGSKPTVEKSPGVIDWLKGIFGGKTSVAKVDAPTVDAKKTSATEVAAAEKAAKLAEMDASIAKSKKELVEVERAANEGVITEGSKTPAELRHELDSLISDRIYIAEGYTTMKPVDVVRLVEARISQAKNTVGDLRTKLTDLTGKTGDNGKLASAKAEVAAAERNLSLETFKAKEKRGVSDLEAKAKVAQDNLDGARSLIDILERTPPVTPEGESLLKGARGRLSEHQSKLKEAQNALKAANDSVERDITKAKQRETTTKENLTKISTEVDQTRKALTESETTQRQYENVKRSTETAIAELPKQPTLRTRLAGLWDGLVSGLPKFGSSNESATVKTGTTKKVEQGTLEQTKKKAEADLKMAEDKAVKIETDLTNARIEESSAKKKYETELAKQEKDLKIEEKTAKAEEASKIARTSREYADNLRDLIQVSNPDASAYTKDIAWIEANRKALVEENGARVANQSLVEAKKLTDANAADLSGLAEARAKISRLETQKKESVQSVEDMAKALQVVEDAISISDQQVQPKKTGLTAVWDGLVSRISKWGGTKTESMIPESVEAISKEIEKLRREQSKLTKEIGELEGNIKTTLQKIDENGSVKADPEVKKFQAAVKAVDEVIAVRKENKLETTSQERDRETHLSNLEAAKRTAAEKYTNIDVRGLTENESKLTEARSKLQKNEKSEKDALVRLGESESNLLDGTKLADKKEVKPRTGLVAVVDNIQLGLSEMFGRNKAVKAEMDRLGAEKRKVETDWEKSKKEVEALKTEKEKLDKAETEAKAKYEESVKIIEDSDAELLTLRIELNGVKARLETAEKNNYARETVDGVRIELSEKTNKYEEVKRKKTDGVTRDDYNQWQNIKTSAESKRVELVGVESRVENLGKEIDAIGTKIDAVKNGAPFEATPAKKNWFQNWWDSIFNRNKVAVPVKPAESSVIEVPKTDETLSPAGITKEFSEQEKYISPITEDRSLLVNKKEEFHRVSIQTYSESGGVEILKDFRSGVMSGDGIFYTSTEDLSSRYLKLLSHQDVLVYITHEQPVPIGDASIKIVGTNVAAIDLVVDSLRRLYPGEIVLVSSTHDFLNNADNRELYNGNIDDYKFLGGKFIPDSQYKAGKGYEVVSTQADTVNKLVGMYDSAKNKGEFLAVRYVGVPVLPSELSSGVMIGGSSGDVPVFEAKIHHTLGGIIYQLSADSMPLVFGEDAHTIVGKNDGSLTPRPDQKKQIVGDSIVLWKDDLDPISAKELLKQIEGGQIKSWNEVLIDPHSDGAKVVGIWNPLKSVGWTRIAKDYGVPDVRGVLRMP